MLLIKTFVANSPIHGAGLFAAEAIPAGRVWWRFDPLVDRVVPDKLLGMMPAEFQEHMRRYGFLHDGFWTLCGDLAIFVNHSDDPPSRHQENASIAARDIAAGEEITEDYSDFHQLGVHR